MDAVDFDTHIKMVNTHFSSLYVLYNVILKFR